MTNSWTREYSARLQLPPCCLTCSASCRRKPGYLSSSYFSILENVNHSIGWKRTLFQFEDKLTGTDTRGVSIIHLYAKRLISLTRNLEHKNLTVASETTEYIASYFHTNKTVMTQSTIVRSSLKSLAGRTNEGICHIEAIRHGKKTTKVWNKICRLSSTNDN